MDDGKVLDQHRVSKNGPAGKRWFNFERLPKNRTVRFGRFSLRSSIVACLKRNDGTGFYESYQCASGPWIP